jgi:ankyrin repeat protein
VTRYLVNVLAWDTKASPLHLAILGGHIDVVKELVQNHGADILLPIKLLNEYDKSPQGAILTLVLALSLPLDQAKAMTRTLLDLGASSAQADTRQTTALYYIANAKPELLDTLVEHDEPAVKRAINHLAVTGGSWDPSASSALMTAITKRNSLAALKLLETGSKAQIDYTDWLKSVDMQFDGTYPWGAKCLLLRAAQSLDQNFAHYHPLDRALLT